MKIGMEFLVKIRKQKNPGRFAGKKLADGNSYPNRRYLSPYTIHNRQIPVRKTRSSAAGVSTFQPRYMS